MSFHNANNTHIASNSTFNDVGGDQTTIHINHYQMWVEHSPAYLENRIMALQAECAQMEANLGRLEAELECHRWFL